MRVENVRDYVSGRFYEPELAWLLTALNHLDVTAETTGRRASFCPTIGGTGGDILEKRGRAIERLDC